MNDRTRDLADAAPAIIAVATFGIVALLAILGFENVVAVAAVVGWFVLTPLSAILGEILLPDETETTTDPAPTVEPESAPATDPVERLRERYADGDVDEDEFERRLDLLLDTEGADVETARERLRNRRNDAEIARERDESAERDAEFER